MPPFCLKPFSVFNLLLEQRRKYLTKSKGPYMSGLLLLQTSTHHCFPILDFSHFSPVCLVPTIRGLSHILFFLQGNIFLLFDAKLTGIKFSDRSIQWPWPSQGCTRALLRPHLWCFPHVFYWGTIYTQRLSLLWSTVPRILPKTCGTTAVKIWNSSTVSSYFPVPLCGGYFPPPHFLATTAVFCPYAFAFSRMSYRRNHVVCREDSSMLLHLFYCWMARVWMYWFCLSTYQLEDICLISSFEKLWTKDNKHLHTGICVNFSFHFSWHTLDFFFLLW